MFKLLKLFAWSLLAIAFLATIDQLLVRVPFELPGVAQAQTFYVDFRGRLLGLFGVEKRAALPQKSIEQLIESGRDEPLENHQPLQRYLYVDDAGALQFADSLELVPQRYRDSAQPLAK